MIYCGKVVYFSDDDNVVEQEEIHYVMVAENIIEVAQRIHNDWFDNLISFTCEEISCGDNAVYFLEEETLDDIRRENNF